jgi:hypothetical protein
MLCPRCGQGDVVKARIMAGDTCLFVCQECEATWFLYEDIGVKSFVDFGRLHGKFGTETTMA